MMGLYIIVKPDAVFLGLLVEPFFQLRQEDTFDCPGLKIIQNSPSGYPYDKGKKNHFHGQGNSVQKP